ncbi:hypothetical protein CPG37_01795 [Malaciobacter canalis]|uniref:Uncharacterized protein n=1 Tax=Malaciobacter canalis TaxID=1912871 RepID=A0ABX4LTC6_9BACT|nr:MULTISPECIES: hypothetical protein [Malaciobacter]PHO11201.1 hypothetical protein CPG37_01795 [Malaciobacter canalis]QEE33291.1 hypothetical protein ACAN_1822 [Malaciobacter canalis]SKB31787.1 hypothetical protein SAMN06295997_10516 [Malaciobacter marinus]
MSYEEIFILGWLANIFMIFANILVVLMVVKTNDAEKLKEQSIQLNELKKEYDKYYPYHKQMTLLAYMLPFTGFFKVGFKLFEMFLFLSKNKEANVYNFIEYKYTKEIQKAKNS